MKFSPPCKVRVKGMTGTYILRRVSQPNAYLREKGWKSFVAHIQNRNGSTVVEYQKLLPIPGAQYGLGLKKKRNCRVEPVELIYEERGCLKCGKKYKALGKLKSGRWFRIDWICKRCKTSDLFQSPGLGRFEGASLTRPVNSTE